jgi:hypothetical protein
MPEPRIADDFAFIASRLKEIEGEKPKPGCKWAVWAIGAQTWCVMRDGRTTLRADTTKPTLFDSETDAKAAISAGTDSNATRIHLIPKPYLEAFT